MRACLAHPALRRIIHACAMQLPNAEPPSGSPNLCTHMSPTDEPACMRYAAQPSVCARLNPNNSEESTHSAAVSDAAE
jgi:hypothetical protein